MAIEMSWRRGEGWVSHTIWLGWPSSTNTLPSEPQGWWDDHHVQGMKPVETHMEGS